MRHINDRPTSSSFIHISPQQWQSNGAVFHAMTSLHLLRWLKKCHLKVKFHCAHLYLPSETEEREWVGLSCHWLRMLGDLEKISDGRDLSSKRTSVFYSCFQIVFPTERTAKCTRIIISWFSMEIFLLMSILECVSSIFGSSSLSLNHRLRKELWRLQSWSEHQMCRILLSWLLLSGVKAFAK